MKSTRLTRTVRDQTYICRACRLICNGPTTNSRRHFASTRLRQQNDKPETPEVKWFEIPRRGANVSEVDHPEENDEAKDVKARIDRLEDELQQIRSGRFLGFQSLLSQLPEEMRAEWTQLMQNHTAGELNDVEPDSEAELMKSISRALATGKVGTDEDLKRIARAVVRMPTRREQKIYLNRLNGYLKQAEAIGVDARTRQQLWRWYVRCKQNIPDFTSHLPDRTWHTLWETQSVESPKNSDRSAHLKELAEDILASGRSLNPAQAVGYIESLFLKGNTRKAIKQWERHEPELGVQETVMEDFWVIGVRMFALQGDTERAHKLAYTVLNSGKVKRPRILIPVIIAWNKAGGFIGPRRAWATYLRLREMLGSEMKMEDYDAVCESFLEAGKADLALGVFKDMMLTGEPLSNQNSSSLFRKAMGTIKDIQSLAFDAPEMNDISLEALTVLPRRFQTKWFYGSWIKKLLGTGAADYAAMVVKLMASRGVRPDAKHMNGILGAWFRNGDATSCEKAEAMGWAMIEERKAFAWRRRLLKREQQSVHVSEEISETSIPVEWKGSLAPATLETFNIFIEHYLKAQNYEKIRWLRRSLSLAEIEPDTVFMNQLLTSYLNCEGVRKVWQTFTEWAHKSHVPAKPDIDTFDLLWYCAQLCVGWGSVTSQDYIHQEQPLKESVFLPGDATSSQADERSSRRKELGFPSPRALFAVMIEWYSGLKPKEAKSIQEQFSMTLYALVLRCFLGDGTRDVAGALIALHAMKQHFGMFPDGAIAQFLTQRIARLDEQPLSRRSRMQDRRHGNDSMVRITQRLADISIRRMKQLRRQGIDLESSDDQFKAEEALHLVSDLLRSVLARKMDPGDAENLIQRAAWDMGVGGISFADHLHSS